jgi:hypothetical protein
VLHDHLLYIPPLGARILGGSIERTYARIRKDYETRKLVLYGDEPIEGMRVEPPRAEIDHEVCSIVRLCSLRTLFTRYTDSGNLSLIGYPLRNVPKVIVVDPRGKSENNGQSDVGLNVLVPC